MNLLIMYLPRNKHMGVDVNFTNFHFRSYHIPFFFLPLISCSRRPLQNSQLVLSVIVPASYFLLFSTNPIHVHYDSAFSDIPLTSNITLLVHSLSIIINPITTIIIITTTPSTIIVTTTTTSSTINITNNTTNTLTIQAKTTTIATTTKITTKSRTATTIQITGIKGRQGNELVGTGTQNT